MPSLNFWGKLNILRKDIRLDEDRKQKLRNLLVHEIEASVRDGRGVRHISQRSIWSQLIINNSLIKNFNPMSVIASLVIALMLGGGVSFAAEGSLPGDALYPVKVSVNEEVRGAITVGAEAKAEWEARRAERRLEEAEELAAEGRISADVLARIEANFETHAGRVNERIARFEAESRKETAADIAVKFETSLRAHEAILARFGDSSDAAAMAGATAEAEAASSTSVGPLRVKVLKQLDEIRAKRLIIDAAIEADLRGEVQSAVSVGAIAAGEAKTETETETQVEAEAEIETKVKTEVGGGVKVEDGGKVNIGL